MAILFLNVPLLYGQGSDLHVYRIKASGQAAGAKPAESPDPSPTASPLPEAATLYQWEHAPPPTMNRPARVVEPANYIDHGVFGRVLKKYVTKSGWVNYRGLKRDKKAQQMLSNYIRDLSKIDPTTLEDPFDRLAAWLNLYNALVIGEVLQHYPVKTLMNIKDFFGARKFRIGEETYSLLDIEIEIFQKKIRDPRAVFARVNGASSGARMLQEPFDPLKIDKQLEERTWNFLNNRENVDFDKRRQVLTLNPTFLWYREELLDVGTFLHSYLDLLPRHYSVAYKGYDWKLNDEKLH